MKSHKPKLKPTTFFNGRLIPEGEAHITALSPGLLYGWGAFETMRSFNNKIIYLDAHLKRIKESCKLLKINFNYTPEKIKKALEQILTLNSLNDAYVRLSVYKGSDNNADISIIVRKYKPFAQSKYKQGFSCMVSGLRQNENSPLSKIKSTSYLFYQIAYLEAQAKGFDEAIILNSAGCICEASRANIFMAKNNKLFTPPLECGCLEGLTRRVILDLASKNKISAHEKSFGLQDLYEADEIFLTNSLMGVMPVKSVEHIRIGPKKIKGSLTAFFAKQYNLLLRNAS
jgi:branched-subunit amino acid aminotransferase/4-amino-4-deoxychorismate lyase